VCAGLSILFKRVDDRDICAIQVPKSPKPVYVGDTGQTRFYLRTGNTTQELTTKESVEYIKVRWAH
jgi:hypothetical protein